MPGHNRPPSIDVTYMSIHHARRKQEQTLLELVNCISEIRVKSLSDEIAFDPLLMLLFSEPLDVIPVTRSTHYHILAAEYLLYSGETAYEPILDYLSSRCPENLRKAVLKLLLKQSDEQIFDGLAQVYQFQYGRGISDEIGSALIKLDKHRAANLFSEIIFTGRTTYARVSAIHALAECRSEDVLLPLVTALQDEDVQVVMGAIAALKEIRSPDAIPFLINAAMDFRVTTRRLPRHQNDRSIAQQAIRALLSYNTAETREIVFQWCVNQLHVSELKGIDWTVKLLSDLQDARAVPHLVTLIENHDSKSLIHALYRNSAIHGLRKIDAPEARTALKRLK